MKTRLAPSLALAATLALGLTGCGLIAPQGTTQPYAPSDGIEETIANIDVRNLMLITNADQEEFNIVFTAVNTSDSTQRLTLDFAGDSGNSVASANFTIEPGTTVFGERGSEREIVSLPGTIAGSTVTVFMQTQGGESEREVPVLDGTLRDASGTYAFPEYRPFAP